MVLLRDMLEVFQELELAQVLIQVQEAEVELEQLVVQVRVGLLVQAEMV